MYDNISILYMSTPEFYWIHISWTKSLVVFVDTYYKRSFCNAVVCTQPVCICMYVYMHTHGYIETVLNAYSHTDMQSYSYTYSQKHIVIHMIYTVMYTYSYTLVMCDISISRYFCSYRTISKSILHLLMLDNY